MNVPRISSAGLAASVAMLIGASTVSADITSGLEVHYTFENSMNLAENSVGPNGTSCG
jgi:hypothetical protein